MHIVYGLRGLDWQDPQRAVLDVLLKVKAQRMFDTLREQQGLVYTVTPMLTLAVGAGTFGIYTACAPDKAEQAVEAIAAELRQGKPPAAEEIEQARQFLAGNWNTEMSRGDRKLCTWHAWNCSVLDTITSTPTHKKCKRSAQQTSRHSAHVCYPISRMFVSK